LEYLIIMETLKALEEMLSQGDDVNHLYDKTLDNIGSTILSTDDDQLSRSLLKKKVDRTAMALLPKKIGDLEGSSFSALR
jgi:hypothetical protein